MQLDDQIPKVNVPEGHVGEWRVERFTISKDDASLFNLRCAFQAGEGHRVVKPGTYTRLLHGGACIMSDTHAERRDHLDIVWRARGKVLINGLGLGVVVNACLLREDVEKVVVIEKSPDVLALVAGHYRAKFGARFHYELADAYTYQPPKGTRYGAVWHDIWSGINTDNLEGMAKLHRKYGKRCDWQGSWCKDLCQFYQQRGR